MSGVDVREAITRVVAFLARHFGYLDIAEEAAADAFATAVERWPADGVPPNPGACPARRGWAPPGCCRHGWASTQAGMLEIVSEGDTNHSGEVGPARSPTG